MPLLHRAAALEKNVYVILGAYHFPLFGIISTISTWTSYTTEGLWENKKNLTLSSSGFKRYKKSGYKRYLL